MRAAVQVAFPIGFSLWLPDETNDAARPVTKVAVVPINTYQVHAMEVSNFTYNISATDIDSATLSYTLNFGDGSPDLVVGGAGGPWAEGHLPVSFPCGFHVKATLK
jgi:hypothetical protein